jgi:metallo-beta-lactamase family protein
MAADNPTKTGSVTVTFWGAAHTVTGSMHLVEANGTKILLDCGLYQGRRAEAWERNSHFPFAPSELAAVVISHGHLDHIGNLPHLVAAGFHGPIHCTPATRDLMAVMLEDSAKIQIEDAEYLNRKRDRREKPVEPLYTHDDVRATMKLVQSTPYEKTQESARSIRHRFVEAGHLLGSAMVQLTIDAGGRERTISFTGDLGRKDQAILRDPAPVPPGELLISESTYGGRNHPGVEMLANELGAVVKRTIARGGKIVIPAFSLGRTQAIVYYLHQLVAGGEVPRLPIFVDSPLSASATEVFRLHPECFDTETSRLLVEDPGLFGEPLVHYIRKAEDSKKLNAVPGPCIIIASSGMCEAGRIQHHLKHNIEDARNTILIIGFQAPETLGRRLVERRQEVKIHDRFWKLKAEVAVLNGFSGHAGRDELLAALAPLKDVARHTRLVHGDPDQAAALLQTLRERGFKDVTYPDRGESITLD